MKKHSNHTSRPNYPKDIADHIASAAHALVVKYALPFEDEADLRQEFSRRIASAARSFDPARSAFSTFARAVVKTARRDIERRLNEPTSVRAETSLDETRTGGSDEERETLPLVEALVDETTDPERMRMAIDVRDAVASLQPRDRDVCRLIMDGATLTDALKRAGVPRSGFYKRILPNLHAALEK